MKLKKLLFVGIMAISMVAFTACSGADEGEITEPPIANEAPDGVTDPATEGEVVEPGASGEIVAKDGTYTGTGTTQDGKGKIDIELTVIDSQIKDFQVTGQDGIEIAEETVESFKTQLLDKQAFEDVTIEEVTGEPQEVDLLMQASFDAYMQAIS